MTDNLAILSDCSQNLQSSAHDLLNTEFVTFKIQPMTFENDIGIAQAQLQAGNYKRAFKASKSAMKKRPSSAFPHSLAGIALGSQGKHRDAALQFKKALALDPSYHDARKNLAQSLILLDQPTPAKTLMKKQVEQTPKDAEAWYLLAQANLKAGDPKGAEQAATTSIEIDRTQARSFNLRALARREMRQTNAALDDFDSICALKPVDPAPLLEAAILLIRLFRPQEARIRLERALNLDPQNARVHNIFAMLMAMEGNRQEAITHYQKVIELEPAHAEAFLQLAELQTEQENSLILPALKAAMTLVPKKSHSLALLHFAQASIRKQIGGFVDEANELALANQIEAALRPYDRRLADIAFSGLTSLRDGIPAAVEKQPIPIFILGLPRSGTTLLEQVLTASDQVFGCGELPMGETLIDLAQKADLDGFSAKKFASSYRAQLPEMPAGTSHFIDKLPGNYKTIGLLHAAFPNARFLHVTRDPRDVALSMWRAYFAEQGLNYVFDQKSMAFEINQYRRYMLHWTAHHNAAILDLRYEDIVTNIETAARKVVEFCGLDWTQNMASPELNTAPVRTASVAQVRAKIHTQSVGGWQNLAPSLTTFMSSLDPELWPELSE